MASQILIVGEKLRVKTLIAAAFVFHGGRVHHLNKLELNELTTERYKIGVYVTKSEVEPKNLMKMRQRCKLIIAISSSTSCKLSDLAYDYDSFCSEESLLTAMEKLATGIKLNGLTQLEQKVLNMAREGKEVPDIVKEAHTTRMTWYRGLGKYKKWAYFSELGSR
jgi:hypothetical protein